MHQRRSDRSLRLMLRQGMLRWQDPESGGAAGFPAMRRSVRESPCTGLRNLVRCFLCVLLMLSVAQGRAELETELACGAPFSLLLEDGLLTVRADAACLGDVLAELARLAPVALRVHESVIDRPVSVSLEKVPIRHGIASILHGMSYLVTMRPSSGRTQSPSGMEIYVLPEGEVSQDAARIVDSVGADEPSHLAQDHEPGELRVGAPGPEMSFGAFESLVDAVGEPLKVQEALTNALTISDPEVRTFALIALVGLEVKGAAEMLAHAASHDQSPTVRMRALELLASGKYPQTISRIALEQATADPDQAISATAQELLSGGRADSAFPWAY